MVQSTGESLLLIIRVQQFVYNSYLKKMLKTFSKFQHCLVRKLSFSNSFFFWTHINSINSTKIWILLRKNNLKFGFSHSESTSKGFSSVYVNSGYCRKEVESTVFEKLITSSATLSIKLWLILVGTNSEKIIALKEKHLQ